MTRKSIMDRIQAALGIARTELIAVIVLLGGLTTGLLIKYVIAEDRIVSYSNDEINYILDSLAEVEAETYTGTTDTAAIELATLKNQKLDTATMKFSLDNPPSEKIDINSAPKEMLMKLPGVGPKTADDIISYRKIKLFRKSSELMEVKGIGVKKFEKVKSFIDVK